MEVSPYILIHQLIVRGRSNNYVAHFKEGLNLIWGDMDSGKSSILNLIDYCLGGKNENLLYDEIKKHGLAAALEIDLNGAIYTFEREILDPAAAIRVHSGKFEKRGNSFPMLMSAFPNIDMPDGWVSDFILDCLGIPKIKIKESRRREDANSDRLSFRDLMKLMYIKQTRVGSDALLDYQNGVLFNKNVEIQKFVYNIYDDRLADLNTDLADENRQLAELRRNEDAVRKFLNEVSISVGQLANIEDALKTAESNAEEIDSSIESLKSDFLLSTDIGLEISNSVSKLRQEINELDANIKLNEKKYDSFVKLSNTYKFDLDALNVSRLARGSFQTKTDALESMACPLCSSHLSINSQFIKDEDIDNLEKSLKNRTAGINKSLEKLRQENDEYRLKHAEISELLKDTLRNFDENNSAKISPLITAIQAMEVTRAAAKVQLSHAERNISIARRFEDIGSKIDAKESAISSIKRAIKTIESALIGLEEVITKLDSFLQKIMIDSGLQNVHGVYYDNKFIAYFRNISYYLTSSGGVRTILSIATYLARLRYLLDHRCNLPSFLMIDTPGQNIGRYRDKDDTSEVSDPSLYENIFKQIIATTNLAKSKERKSQIIVVDNDKPDFLIDGVNFHLVKRFDKKGGDFEKGLINDA